MATKIMACTLMIAALYTMLYALPFSPQKKVLAHSVAVDGSDSSCIPGSEDSSIVKVTDMYIPAADGIKIGATYYSPGKPGPAVILFHQCNDNLDRKSWATLASALAHRGIHVLTYDHRGHGETPAAGGSENPPADADAALATLLAQPGVDRQHIGVGGASCGAAYAMALVMRSGHTKALMLLSGQLGEKGLEYMGRHSELEIFVAASLKEDNDGLVTRKMVAASKNPASKAVLVQNAGHGVYLLVADTSLVSSITEWFDKALKN